MFPAVINGLFRWFHGRKWTKGLLNKQKVAVYTHRDRYLIRVDSIDKQRT